MLDLHYTTLKFFVNRLFSDISVSQGGVVGWARCGRICNNDYCKFTKESSGEKHFDNWLRFDRMIAVSLWLHFYGRHPVQILCCVIVSC